MGPLIAFFLLVAVSAQIPTDAELTARVEEALRAQFHPNTMKVTLERKSATSTTIEKLEIAMGDFNADTFPLTAASQPAPNTPPGKMVTIKEARLTGEYFTARALEVQRMEITFTDVRVPLEGARDGKFTVAAAGSAKGYIQVTEESLAAFLRTLDLPITTPTVALSKAEMRINGSTPWVVGVPVGVAGPLYGKGGGIYMAQPRLLVTAVPVPRLVGDRVLRGIHPLTDLNRDLHLAVPITVTHVATDVGTMRVEFTLNFPKPE